MRIETPPGKERFLYFIQQVQLILSKAAGSPSPGRVLYAENLRTPLFMLEALSRLHRKIHNHHQFTELRDRFKELEDSLGAIDFYDAFHKEFSALKKIPAELTGYFEKSMGRCLENFEKDLKNIKWIGKNQKGISKIIKQLDHLKWPEEKEYTQEILKVYLNEISKVNKKYPVQQLRFENIETDVHELRRQLRWLSIYPQALGGLMQLCPDKDPPDYLKKYLTQEILKSPFNIMPDGSHLQEHIGLHTNYFYALSWIISALGKLKDAGLTIVALEEGLDQVYDIHKGAASLALALSPDEQIPVNEILQQSEQIAKVFFQENILDPLVTGVF